MTADDRRARQLQIAIGAVEDGMLDSLAALRAISQWLSDSESELCELLLVQPDLTDASKQSLKARFAEVAFDALNTQPAEAVGQTIDASGIRRLQLFLEEPDEVTLESTNGLASSPDSTLDFSRGTAAVEPASDATKTFVQGAETTAARAHSNFILEHFQVVREFARGGLGVLYLAQDKRLQRQVILKKIRPEHARSGLAREKFVLEAEVTGQLEHPGIVPVYVLGTDGQREPYYAMRLIGGKNLQATIREFHADRTASERTFDGLRFRELLQRFIDVCRALHYAHSRGVIHRDLKPANIMLGDHGETLVIDWGLAKSLSAPDRAVEPGEQDPAFGLRPIQLSGEIDLSLEGQFAGTLRYAPPEQLAGQLQRLCPASDVYSLGAILVEILCNAPALDGPLENAKMALAKINQGELRQPRQIVAHAPRPLNAICVKAMAVSIPDRYSSAQELAEEVQRWLADECVLAYRLQESRLEQAGRWLRHHRSWAAGMALSLLVLSVSALTANYFINQARINEKVAKQAAIEFKQDAVARYRIAKAAVDTLLDRSDKLLDIEGTQAVRAQLLQEAATKYAQLSQTESQDPELEIERARAMVRLADALMLQGQGPDAIKQYDQVIAMLTPADSVSLLSELTEESAAITIASRIELGRSLTRRAIAYAHLQEFDSARSDFHRAIDLLNELQARHTDASKWNVRLTGNLIASLAGNLAIAQLNLAVLEEGQSRDAIALPLAESSLEQYASRDLMSERVFAVNLVQTHQLLERLRRKLGQRDQALEHLRAADAAVSTLLAQNAEDAQTIELRANLWVSAASNASSDGDYAQALDALDKALPVYDLLDQRWPGSTNYVLGAAITHLDMALVYAQLEELPKGQPHLERSFLLFASLEDSLPRNQLARYQADALDTAGIYLLNDPQNDANTATTNADILTRFDDALALLQPQIERRQDQPHELIPLALQAARIQSHRAQCHAQAKQTDAAKSDFDRAAKAVEVLLSQSLSNAHATPTTLKRQLAHVLWHRALMEHEIEEVAAATADFERALELWREVFRVERTPLHQFELAKFYLLCPVEKLKDKRQAIENAQACARAFPDNVLFSKFLNACLK